MPSVDVITRLPTPEEATATNFSLPDAPPYATENHGLSAALVRPVHVMPSVDVITRLPTPS